MYMCMYLQSSPPPPTSGMLVDLAILQPLLGGCWLTDCLAGKRIKRSALLANLTACWLAGLLSCWPAGCLTGLLACWLAGLLAVWLAEWLGLDGMG